MATVKNIDEIVEILSNLPVIELAKLKNPRGRITQPQDVAHAIVVLSREESGWISGNVIGVDGAESIVSFMTEKGLSSLK